MNQRRIILWDLENTLYPFSPAFGAVARQALATTITELDIGMSPAQAWEFAQPTYPLQTIARLEKITLLDRHELFLKFHDNLAADFIEPDPLLAQDLQLCQARHALITHSSRKFAARALAKLGISQQFPEELRLTAEDLRGIGKNDAAAPILLALKRLGAQPQQAVLIDDRDDNLKYAKALGLATVLVGNRGEELDAQYCDAFFSTASSFLRHYNAGLPIGTQPLIEKRRGSHALKP